MENSGLLFAVLTCVLLLSMLLFAWTSYLPAPQKSCCSLSGNRTVRLRQRVYSGLLMLLFAIGLLLAGSLESTWLPGVQAATQNDQKLAALPLVPQKYDRQTARRLEAGREIFGKQCLACHSIGGPEKDIRKVTANVATVGMEAYLTGQGKLFKYMPPFEGDAKARRAVAEYITLVINGRQPDDHDNVPVKPLHEKPAPFDKDSEYVLLSWNTLGMKCVTDADSYFSMLPPANALGAVLVKRGPKPRMVNATEAILTYEAPQGFKNPSAHVDFWKYAPSLMGKDITPNISFLGKGMDGNMTFSEKSQTFEAPGIPLVPYADDGSINPYPVFKVTAKDLAGKELIHTKVVAPVGTEAGCRKCHGGEWRVNGVAGISNSTAANILAVHDKRSGTNLKAQAESGKPVLCQSCHPDPVISTKADPARLNLPTAIHGFHVQYLTGQGEEACSRCHPDSNTGLTRCLRDNHAAKGFGCSRCHGFLEDHALTLLKGEQKAGKARSEMYMDGLKPRVVANVEAINARTPWAQEPDCSTCHKNGIKPDVQTASAFNVWTQNATSLYRAQKDVNKAMPCISCHGAPHATYPARNAYGAERDNLQPLQYMAVAKAIGANGNCDLCHTVGKPVKGHHPW